MKQHFLPQCYLKEFCNDDGKLHTLNLDYLKYKKKVFDEPKFPVEVCKIPDFYTIKDELKERFKDLEDLDPFHVENQFHKYEREYPRLVTQIKSKTTSLSFSDAFLFLYAIIDIKMRNQHFRKTAIEDKKEGVIDKLFNGYRKELENVDVSAFLNITKEEMLATMDRMREELMTNDNYTKNSHITTLIGQNKAVSDIHLQIINRLFKYQWIIFESDNQFITTDNPGASVDDSDKVHNTKFAENIMFFMPLTPSLCLGIATVIFDQDFVGDRSQKLLTFAKVPPSFVEKINQAQTYYITKYLFSASKNLIEEMAERINIKIESA